LRSRSDSIFIVIYIAPASFYLDKVELESIPETRVVEKSIDEKLEQEELKPVPEADRTVPGPRSIEGRLEQERVAWDYYGPAWMRVLNQIRKEKDQRRHELLLIDRRKSKLDEWM
jgi:hypothetical protein